MDGIQGLLARDFGVRPQGKAAPMAGASSRSTGSAAGAGAAAWASYGRSTTAPSAAPSYDDLFGGPAPASFDSLFDSFNGPTTTTTTTTTTTKPAAPSPAPAPAYDDDIFDALPGLRSSTTSSVPRYDDGVFGSSAAPAYDDVFATSARAAATPPPAYDDDLLAGFGSAEKRRPVAVDDDDDLLGAFGRSLSEEKRNPVAAREDGVGSAGFDDLIPGFAGSRSPPWSRKPNDNNKMKPPVPTSKQTASMADDPFVVLETASASGSAYTSPGRSADPVEDLDKSTNSDGQAANNTADDDSLFGEPSAFDQAAKSDPLFTSEINGHARDTNLPSVARDSSPLHRSMDRNPARQSSVEDRAVPTNWRPCEKHKMRP